MTQLQTINQSFVSTVANSELTGVTSDLAEVAFDTILKDGVLKDIPFVGAILGTYKGVLSIRDHMFVKKVVAFLTSLNTLTIHEREQMFIKLEKQGKNRQKVGEAILLTLEKLDDYNKASLLGTLMKSLSRSIITYDEFVRFSSIINRAFVDDLKSLSSFTSIIKDSKIASSLYSLGLVYPTSYFSNKQMEESEYRISEMGLLLCQALEFLP